MKNKTIASLALAVALAPAASAQSISASYADLSFLYVTPQNETDSVIFNGWTIQGVAQSDSSTPMSDSDSGQSINGVLDFFAAVDFHEGDVYLNAEFPDDPYGGVTQFAGSFVPAYYTASGDAEGSFTGTFRITGGVGSVEVDIDALLSGAAVAATAGPGYTAFTTSRAEIYLNDSLLGSALWSATAAGGDYDESANDEDQWIYTTHTLLYDTDYELTIELDAFAIAIGNGSIPPQPVPETSTLLGGAIALGLAGLTRLRRQRAA